MDNFLDLNPDQIQTLENITGGGHSNFPEGYRYLYSIARNMRPNGDSVHDKDLTDLQYWLKNAPDINENNPSSAANHYIRAVTSTGLRWSGDYNKADKVEVQHTSDEIGQNVIGEIIQAKGIPSLSQLVGHDIHGAITTGGLTPAGWGGSAYYWDLPYTDEHGDTLTVGQRILSDPAEHEKFVAVNAAAIKQMAQHYNLAPIEFAKAADAGSQAALPAGLRNAIVNRIADNLTNGASLAGDPENIDGYTPVYSYPEGNVTGWRRQLGMGRSVEVSDQDLADQLSRRRQIRLEKGSDESWAEAPHATPSPSSQSGQAPATDTFSPTPSAYVSVPYLPSVSKNALNIYTPSPSNALFSQPETYASGDSPDPSALEAMALMRSFGLPPGTTAMQSIAQP